MMSRPTPRVVAVAAALQRDWDEAVHQRRPFELGLLLGQRGVLHARDSVLAAVAVPPESDDGVPRDFEDLSSDWVQEVAKQVDRLLPGGLELLGLYVVSPADARAVMDQASCYLRAVAQAIALPSEFDQPLGDDAHCIVHICTKTGRTIAKTFSHLRDAGKTTGHAAELKAPTGSSTMRSYVASVAVDQAFAFSRLSGTSVGSGDDAVEIAEKRIDEVHQQVLPLAERIWCARGIHARRRRLSRLEEEDQEIEIELLTRDANPDIASMPAKRVTGHCRGVIQCVAFVPADEPRALELATHYLKRDFVKSLLLRIDLLLERWSDEANAADATSPFVFRDGGTVLLPRRARMAWCSKGQHQQDRQHEPLQLTLHVFQDDDAALAVQNALELLGGGGNNQGDGATSLHWMESESDTFPVGHGAHVASKQHPPLTSAATTSQQAKSTLGMLFVVLPVVLLLIALLLAQQLQ